MVKVGIKNGGWTDIGVSILAFVTENMKTNKKKSIKSLKSWSWLIMKVNWWFEKWTDKAVISIAILLLKKYLREDFKKKEYN